MNIVQTYTLDIWEIFLEMSPYLLLGFAIAGVLHVFMPKALFQKHLGKPNLASIIKAALFGIPLPLCSCGVIPTGISLRKNGASKGATNSFLISTPQTGVDSILITYSLMNIYWAVARPIIALITAVFGGWLTDKLDKTVHIEVLPEAQKNEYNNFSIFDKIKRVFTYAFIEFLSDIARPLVFGVLLAAVITNLISPSLFENYLTSPLINMLVILIASIPLYVCATASVPVATALLIVGVSPGAVLVFLMAGPATNIATITVLWKSLGKKTTLIYLSAIILGAFTFGFLIDYVLPTSLFMLNSSSLATHTHDSNNWLSIIASIILIALILWVEIKKHIPTMMTIKNNQKQYLVDGMTCNHCKASVEKNVALLPGVTVAEVDLPTHTLVIEGEISEAELAQKINDLGYEFKGSKS